MDEFREVDKFPDVDFPGGGLTCKEAYTALVSYMYVGLLYNSRSQECSVSDIVVRPPNKNL